MAHFAELNVDNIVTRVIIVSNEILINDNGVEDENLGVEYCNYFFRENKSQLTRWKQTSYNGNIRVRYAFPGCTYNEEFDAFIPPKPFESWILDETKMNWISPLGNHPELLDQQFIDGYSYYWDENLYLSDNTKGWVLENMETAQIIASGVSSCGGKIFLIFEKNIMENQYDLDQLNYGISIKIQGEVFRNIISSISFEPQGPVTDKNFLNIEITNCSAIEDWQDVYITYDKELVSPEHRLKTQDNYDVRSFINYKLTNTSNISTP